MVALTEAANRPFKIGNIRPYPLAAATVIYKGAGVCTNAAGFAVPAADAVGLITVGVADETIDNSAGIAGALSIAVRAGAIQTFATVVDLTAASVGTSALWSDDNTFDVALSLTNDIVAGLIVEYVSTTEVKAVIG